MYIVLDFLCVVCLIPLSDPEATARSFISGTKIDYECSRQGYCNADLGRCECLEGFQSSSGDIYVSGERYVHAVNKPSESDFVLSIRYNYTTYLLLAGINYFILL
jgi:hypothetical protein